jgi:putative phage-type endonuclease
MRLVNLTPGTQEWKNWRRTKITASDAPSILGASPWKSISDLYIEKLFKIEKEDNPYMARGRYLEPIALEAFEEETGLVMFPAVVESDSIDWMGASLDGLSIDQKAFVEIKCSGKLDHAFVVEKRQPPNKYIAQIQHQIFCTGLEFAYYFSFDGDKGITIEVPRDQEFIEKMIAKEFEFWNCLRNFTPPEILPKTRKRKNATGTVPKTI